MTKRNLSGGEVVSYVDGVKSKARSVAAQAGIAEPSEWGNLLIQVRIATRVVKLDQLDLSTLHEQECEEIIGALGHAAAYLSQTSRLLEAAHIIMLDAMTRPDGPLASP